ncbi:dTDP-4-amino-4,6-dideoxygalactose transaminase [compost metagenome]
MMSSYKGRQLGSIGHLGAYSFHETKNYTSGGEGGLLLINDERFINRAEIIREKGTNRSQFFRGMVDKYSWVDVGSSYLPSEIQAAYLWGQLEKVEEINSNRLATWNYYQNALASLARDCKIVLPSHPVECIHNAHMLYLKVKNLDERTSLLDHLKNSGVLAVFHYIPLHSATAGPKFSRFHGEDNFTTTESERLIRLPIWHGMSTGEVQKVVQSVFEFFA